MARKWSELIEILRKDKRGAARAAALILIQENGWWSYKTLLSRVFLTQPEISALTQKACAWVKKEHHCHELLGDARITPPLRLAIVQRVPEVMDGGNCSCVALWALRGLVFPTKVPMTAAERKLLLETFKRPGRDSQTDNLFAHSLVVEYGDGGLTLSEMKELLPFAVKYACGNRYDAYQFLKNECLHPHLTDDMRRQLESVAAQAAA